MCGVFGFVSYNGQGPNLARLRTIARSTMARGPHAFGFSWVDGRGRLRMFKKPGRIVDHLDTLDMLQDAQMLIAHCRYATHGRPEQNINNHPHPADGGWLVHNGVIREYQEIVMAGGFTPVTSCDTEALALMIEDGDGPLLERAKQAATAADSGPLVMLGLWNRPRRLIVVRNGNPLSIGRCEENRFYLASYGECLPGKVSEVKDGTAMEFTENKLRRACDRLPRQRTEQPKRVSSGLWD